MRLSDLSLTDPSLSEGAEGNRTKEPIEPSERDSTKSMMISSGSDDVKEIQEMKDRGGVREVMAKIPLGN
jgi:hypothetical protein